MVNNKAYLDDVLNTLSYEQKLAMTAFVFQKLEEHANSSGSFRYLIYQRLGFNSDAYSPLYFAGGLNISNEFKIVDTVNSSRLKDTIDRLSEVANNAPMINHPSLTNISGEPIKTPSVERSALFDSLFIIKDLLSQLNKEQIVKEALKAEIAELVESSTKKSN